ISSRTRPPLPFGRLRLSSDVTELQAADLRLTDEEGHALLSRAPRLAGNQSAITVVMSKADLLVGQFFFEAAQLLEQYALPMLGQGEVARLLRGLRQLPPSVLHERPALLLIKARALMLTGELNALEAWLEHLESTSPSQT